MTRINTFDDYREITFEAVEDYNRQDYDLALAKFLDLAETNPGNPKVHEILVLIYLKLDMLEQAQEAFERYHALLAESVPHLKLPARRTFQDLCREAGDQKELERECAGIMQENGAFDMFRGTDTVSRLGIVYMAQGDYRKAEELLLSYKEKVLATRPLAALA